MLLKKMWFLYVKGHVIFKGWVVRVFKKFQSNKK
jgi:hypothetical protein